MARKAKYTEAEKKARRSATQKKYYARKKATMNLQQAQAEYNAAYKAYTESMSQTLSQAYAADPKGWDEIDSVYELWEDDDEYYNKPMIDIYRERKNDGDDTTSIEAAMKLVGISEAQARYLVASENYTQAQAEYINTFNKSLSAWL